MTTIIAGRFEAQTQVDAAVRALRDAGFPSEHISSFYLTPAGQHARTPIGGDHAISQGAEATPQGTAAGMAGGGLIGAAVGAITTPLTGPLGAVTGGLVGAHIGNLVGALGAMKEDDAATHETPPIRQAGLRVAVATPTLHSAQQAIAVLRAQGGDEIESAQGQIVGSDWRDFDPSLPPQRIDAPSSGGQAPR